MRNLGLVLVFCGAFGLAFAPGGAFAFEIQGEGENLPEHPAAKFQSLNTYVLPEFHGSSLAMPYNSKSDGSGFASDYGNAIPIPAPGVDLPRPAWAY